MTAERWRFEETLLGVEEPFTREQIARMEYFASIVEPTFRQRLGRVLVGLGLKLDESAADDVAVAGAAARGAGDWARMV
jgi:hypothetical protein